MLRVYREYSRRDRCRIVEPVRPFCTSRHSPAKLSDCALGVMKERNKEAANVGEETLMKRMARLIRIEGETEP
jgi:hypothetical protein